MLKIKSSKIWEELILTKLIDINKKIITHLNNWHAEINKKKTKFIGIKKVISIIFWNSRISGLFYWLSQFETLRFSRFHNFFLLRFRGGLFRKRPVVDLVLQSLEDFCRIRPFNFLAVNRPEISLGLKIREKYWTYSFTFVFGFLKVISFPASFLALIFDLTFLRCLLISVADLSLLSMNAPRAFPSISSGAIDEYVETREGPISSDRKAGVSLITLISISFWLTVVS